MSVRTFQRHGIYLALLLAPLPALASLGGNAASVNHDMTALRSSATSNATLATSGSSKSLAAQAIDITPAASPYQVKAFTTEDGTVVREYISNDNVFGVAWNGPVIPDLSQLFGSANYATYRSSLDTLHKAHSQRSSHRAVNVSEPGLVVHSFGRVPHFSGSAYIPQLVPANVATSDIQ